jgi:hypothetical protein
MMIENHHSGQPVGIKGRESSKESAQKHPWYHSEAGKSLSGGLFTFQWSMKSSEDASLPGTEILLPQQKSSSE